MKKATLIFVSVLVIHLVEAQQRPIIKIDTEIRYPTRDKYHGKYVILDLFNSNCIACFQMMPKVNELQQKFTGRLNFLLIGEEDGRIAELYAKFEKRLKLKLDVTFDSALFNRYQLDYVPRYIWIRPDGKVAAVTGSNSVTAENIDRFLAGKFYENAYDDKPLRIDYKKPFALGGNGGPDSVFLFRSFLTVAESRTPWLQPVKLNYYPGTSTFNTTKVLVDDLYMYAYLGKNYWLFKDSMYGKYFNQPIYIDDELIRDSTRYCYSFTTSLPNPGLDMLKRSLRNDLQNYFGYQAFLVPMKVPYWSVIVDPSARESLKTKGGKSALRSDHGSISAINVKLAKVIEILDSKRPEGLQFFDESALPFNIDLDVEANFVDVADFFAALAAKGIRIVKAEKEMLTLVLKKGTSLYQE